MLSRTAEDYVRAEGEAGLCELCKMRLRMLCDSVCSRCHAREMYWLFRGHHYEIRDFRDAGKGG
jgi:hypothetical protein